jgi:hypothetical protein
MSSNKKIPWSVKLIEKYEDRWDWKGEGLSRSEELPWSIGLIEKYDYKWFWDGYDRGGSADLQSIYLYLGQ